MFAVIEKMTESMRGKVQLMIGRAILVGVNDGSAIQTAQAQLLVDEIHDEVERIQEYGYTSVPLSGAEAVIACVGGNRDHGLIIAVDDRRYRLTGLAGGEVAIYDDQGQKVHLTRSGIVISGAGKPVTITDTPKVRIESELEVTGEIKDRCDSSGITMSTMRDIFNGHTHIDSRGGGTTPPNGSM